MNAPKIGDVVIAKVVEDEQEMNRQHVLQEAFCSSDDSSWCYIGKINPNYDKQQFLYEKDIIQRL